MIKLLIAILFNLAAVGVAFAYTPPIGIPDPSWGAIHPIDTPTPDQSTYCPNWPDSVNSEASGQDHNCYYVDQNTGTDSGRTYGTPSLPRATVPTNATFAAGSYIYIAAQQTALSQNLTFNCSESEPCWITSSPKTVDSTSGGGFTGGGRIVINGSASQYVFIENLLTSNKTSVDSSNSIYISNAASTTNSMHHMVVRNCVWKDIEYHTSESAVGTIARDGGKVYDVVIYGNTFKNVGDPLGTVDEDLHSVGLTVRDSISGTESYNLWFLNNTCSDSTQCIQINAGAEDRTTLLHHIYVGDNYGENERQRSFSTKQATHVIFSQNETVPGVNRASGDYSEGYGWSLGADYVWFIFNKSHGGVSCIRNSDSTGSTSSTSHVFIVGNVCYDSSIYSENQVIYRMPVALNFEKGGSTVHVVDNTFVNAISGIKTEGSDFPLYAHGNVFYGVNSGYSFINFYSNTNLSDVHMGNNLYYDSGGNPRWNYTSTFYNTYAAWDTQYPELNGGTQYVDPLFVDIANKNFNVSASSPAVSANVDEYGEYSFPDVYALFESTYGIDIRVDYNGNPRPPTGNWTLGAFEFNTAKFNLNGTGQIPLSGSGTMTLQ